jgi:hypothetical protein
MYSKMIPKFLLNVQQHRRSATHSLRRMRPTRTEALDAISQVMLQLQAHIRYFQRSVKQCPRVLKKICLLSRSS